MDLKKSNIFKLKHQLTPLFTPVWNNKTAKPIADR